MNNNSFINYAIRLKIVNIVPEFIIGGSFCKNF
jgi:hypothetical protein